MKEAKTKEQFIIDCYNNCKGADDNCDLYKDMKPYLDEGEACSNYKIIGNDVDKLVKEQDLLLMGAIVGLVQELDDVQFHVDMQGLEINVTRMYDIFSKWHEKKELTNKQKYDITRDNVWDVIDCKININKTHGKLGIGVGNYEVTYRPE